MDKEAEADCCHDHLGTGRFGEYEGSQFHALVMLTILTLDRIRDAELREMHIRNIPDIECHGTILAQADQGRRFVLCDAVCLCFATSMYSPRHTQTNICLGRVGR